MSEEQNDYASFLLRLMKLGTGTGFRGGLRWRAQIDGLRLEFGSVATLIGFLQERYGQTEEGVSASDERR